MYQLLKAVQSVVYALFRVNIFANASSKSYSSMAGSAKKAKNETKALAGIHDEINNVQKNDNADNGSGGGSSSPSFDLSTVNPSSSIMDAIANGDWYQVGALLAQKINEAMASIDWGAIQEKAVIIATNIGNFINGAVDNLDWNLLGYTIGQGINTAFLFADTLFTTINFENIGRALGIGLGNMVKTIQWDLVGKTFADGFNMIIRTAYGFVTTFPWSDFGVAIGTAINNFFANIEWDVLAQTLSTGLIGIFNTITGFFTTLDWGIIIDSIIDFFANVDYSGISDAFFQMLGSAVGSLVNLGVVIGERINQAIDLAAQYFMPYVELCGGNIIEGVLLGIVDALIGIGNWVIEHIFQPFIEGFKNAFGIHSPSTVMAEMGRYIIEGLKNGIASLIDTIKEIWKKMKETAVTIFNNVKDKLIEIWNNIKSKGQEIWENIKTTISTKINNLKTNISNVLNSIKSTWTNAWNGMKNTVINIWNGIWSGIKGVINCILGGIEGFANGIVRGINKVLSGLDGIVNAVGQVIGIDIHVSPLSEISLPRLAKGNVAYDETLAIFGEYAGASNNPEITAPQNILRETFEDVLSRNGGNNQPISLNLTVKVSDKKLGTVLIEDLKSIRRQTGKDLEVLVGG